jgi:hypothetical protein
MKKYTLILLMLLLTSFSFAHDENVTHYVNMENAAQLVNPNGNFEYMIVKGDYLWMLADKFYDDPFKWTEIHEVNPYIIDPDWIYPNNWLVIPNVFADANGNPMYSDIGISTEAIGVAIDLDGDGIVDGVDLDGDGIIDAEAGIDINGDGVIDGYDADGDGEIDFLVGSTITVGATQIDLDGDGIIDGIDLDGDGIIDAEAGIDIDGDGVIDGYDIDGDGEIDVKSSAALAAAYGIDLDGDGVIDGVDLDGDGVIDANAGIDIDGDGVINGYDTDGDGNIDILAGAAAAATAAIVADDSLEDEDVKKSCTDSYCGKPGWKLGLHAGYPLGSAPEDESLNLGLLLATPLGVKVGPLNVGLGAGASTYNFEDFYVGGGVLASLCVNDLLKLDMPLIIQLHGAGFYIFGDESGPGFGGLASGSMPLGKTPLSLGVYGGLGKYYPGDSDFNWANAGAVLFYSL